MCPEMRATSAWGEVAGWIPACAGMKLGVGMAEGMGGRVWMGGVGLV